MSSKENRKKNNNGSSFKEMLRRMFGLGPKHELSILEEEQMQSPMRTVLKNFFAKRLAIVGMVVFAIILLTCFIGSAVFPLDRNYQDATQQNIRPGFNFMSVPGALKNNASQIDAGSTFGAGIDNNGSLYLWGTLSNKLKAMPRGMGKIAQVSCGLDHILVLTEDNKLYTWGYDRLNLDKIPEEAQDADIVQIEAGHQISVALDSEGRVYIWGNQNIISISPGKYQGTIEKITLNTTTALAVTRDGQVVCMTNKETPFNAIPDEVQGKAVDVVSTDKTAAAVTEDGYIYLWGSFPYNEDKIPEGVQGNVKQLVAGRGHFTALLKDGTVVSWGQNNHGQANAPALKNIEKVFTNYYQNYAVDSNGNVYTWGLKGYLFGTDQYGRDVFRRLLTGGRITLTIGAISVIISGILGIIIGGFSGYYGGKVDMILMRAAEIVGGLPFLPLAMILSYLIGNKIPETGRIFMIMMILGVLSWPGIARLVRAQMLSAREQEFVTAAKALGIKEVKIIFRHILPNVITVALVNLTLSFATSMLTESSLSFLGFGVTEPSPTWGNMLTASISTTVLQDYWWRWVFPALFLSIATICINVVGDALRDAVDPKAGER
ncbi:MAG: ABC transporter permease subunit [Clostridiales bacterium]|nr:ABC transporter permease subunit [Clostridiales bacterium]